MNTAVGQTCARCHRQIQAGGQKVIRDSTPGAQPNVWAHDIRDPSCRPPAGAR